MPMNAAARLTITVSLAPTGSFVVHPEPAASADLALNIERSFASQSAAEHYADGVAAGLRACGRTVEISIDVPEEPTISEDDADLLDFGSFDAWAQDRAVARAETPEADPVAARLARDAEAGHYRAAAFGL